MNKQGRKVFTGYMSKGARCCRYHPALIADSPYTFLLGYGYILQKRVPLSAKHCLQVQPPEPATSTLAKPFANPSNFSGLFLSEISPVQPSKFTSPLLQDHSYNQCLSHGSWDLILGQSPRLFTCPGWEVKGINTRLTKYQYCPIVENTCPVS